MWRSMQASAHLGIVPWESRSTWKLTHECSYASTLPLWFESQIWRNRGALACSSINAHLARRQECIISFFFFLGCSLGQQITQDKAEWTTGQAHKQHGKMMNTLLLCGSLHVAYQLCLNGCSHGVLLSRIRMASICVGKVLWTSVSETSAVHGVVPGSSEGHRWWWGHVLAQGSSLWRVGVVKTWVIVPRVQGAMGVVGVVAWLWGGIVGRVSVPRPSLSWVLSRIHRTPSVRKNRQKES